MKYVLIFTEFKYQSGINVLLIEKNKPEWMAGRWNLLGGKVEEGETFIEAGLRELKEESGLVAHQIEEYGQIVDEITGDIIVCVKAFVKNPEINPRPEETEAVGWVVWKEVQNDPRLMTNLKVMIPLFYMNVKGWTFTYRDEHNFIVSFQS